MSRPVRLKALDIMLDLARDNVHEYAFNRGPMVDKIIEYAGGQLGEPWCVDGVIWAWGHAGSGVIRPGFPRAVSLMDTAKTRALPPAMAKPGQPLRFVFDHTGLFIGWRRRVGGRFVRCPRWAATHAMTVEANTGRDGARSDSSSATDGVHVRYRSLSLIRDVIVTT